MRVVLTHEQSLTNEQVLGVEHALGAEQGGTVSPSAWRTRVENMLRVEWLGQTVASLCWIGSVFFYGISSIGDWLQLIAASAWLLANIAAVFTVRGD